MRYSAVLKVRNNAPRWKMRRSSAVLKVRNNLGYHMLITAPRWKMRSSAVLKVRNNLGYHMLITQNKP